jgi:DUF1365 family protein
MNSAIYRGWVRHRRRRPVRHAFRYGLFMLYLDLAELDTVFAGRWLWSSRRAAPAWFRRRDHFGDPDVPLDTAVRDLVEARTGHRPPGSIRLLTHLRYFGYCFNPISVFYCFDENDDRVECLVAEVTNTPWGERHCYVLDLESDASPSDGHQRHRFAKALHVSPFMQFDHTYDWRSTRPAGELVLHMASHDDLGELFDATLVMERKDISGPELARTLAAHPLMTAKVILAIHWEALRLWFKGLSVVDHSKPKTPTARKEHESIHRPV